MRKKITMAVLSFILILGMAVGTENRNVYASESKSVENNVQVLEQSKTISYDEAVQLIMEKEGVSLSTAKERLAVGDEKTSGMRAASGTTSYKTYTKTYNLTNGYTVEIGGVWKMYTSGSFRQFNAIASKWLEANGDGPYTWNKYHITDVTTSYPTTKVSLSGRGCMEIAVNTSTSAGASIGSDLLGVGFSTSKTVGSTTYYRWVKNVSMTKSLY